MDNDFQSSVSGLSDAGFVGENNVPGSTATGSEAAWVPAGVTQAPAQPSASPAVPNPNVPHAGLRSILQSLFQGMDAFATAAATGGREGGAEQVMAERRAQQDMELKRQAAARETATANAQLTHLQ